VRALLTPKPFRGDVIAAGVVVLTTLVWTLVARFDGTWSTGVHLAYCAVALAFVGAMAAWAPMEGEAPRAYQSVLYVATIALWIPALGELAQVLGADEATSSTGVVAGEATATALLAFGFAVGRNSAVCTLIGAVAAGIALLAATDAVFDVEGIATFRWILLGFMVVCAFAAIGQRDRRPRHGVALIDAAGLAVLGIAATFTLGLVLGVEVDAETGDLPGVAWGWELLIVSAGFGLIAYSSVDRQPGPAYLGVANLVLFTLITSSSIQRATLLGWPLALALAAGFLLAVGLRPTTPAPPPPDVDAPSPPPLPLR
jgi:hypothetical protein